MTAKSDLVASIAATIGANAMVNAGEFTAANTDICTKNGHGFVTGSGPLRLATTDTDLPAGLEVDTDYYAVRLDADTFKLASSYANAVASPAVVVDITDAGTGTHTIGFTGTGVGNKVANAVDAGFQTSRDPGNRGQGEVVASDQFYDAVLAAI